MEKGISKNNLLFFWNTLKVKLNNKVDKVEGKYLSTNDYSNEEKNFLNNLMDKNCFLNLVYPIGSIYVSVSSANPSTLFGGTWERFGKGRTLVSIDENDGDFSSVEKIGGSKELQKHNHNMSHTHSFSATTSTNGNHAHRFQGFYQTSSGTVYNQHILSRDRVGGDPNSVPSAESYEGNHSHTVSGTTKDPSTVDTQYYGTGDSGNLQPYIAVYMWKRIN